MSNDLKWNGTIGLYFGLKVSENQWKSGLTTNHNSSSSIIIISISWAHTWVNEINKIVHTVIVIDTADKVKWQNKCTVHFMLVTLALKKVDWIINAFGMNVRMP